MEEKKNLKARHTNPQTARLILRDLWQYDKSVFRTLALFILFTVMSTAGGMLLPPFAIALFGGDFTRQQIVPAILAAFAVYALIQAGQTYLGSIEHMMYIPFRAGDFWRRLLQSAADSDYEFYESEDSRNLFQKAVNANGANIHGIEGFLHGLSPFLAAVLGLIIYAMMISFVSPLIVLLLFALSAVSYLAYLIMHKRALRFKDMIDKEDRKRYYFKELCYDLPLGKDIRLYQSHPLIRRLHLEIYRRIRGLQKKRENSILVYEWIVEFLSCARDAVCYGYLIHLMRTGALSVATFVLYLGVVSGFSAYFQEITEKLAKMNEDLSMAAFTYDWLTESVPVIGEKAAPAGIPEIIFDHVTYRYAGAEDAVIRDFCLHIRPGETLALVGVNGAGKTTLVKLLSGLYHPTSGRILVNGEDLKTIDPSSFRKKIGVLFQDTNFFSFTIGENISACYEGNYDEARVLSAVRRAGLEEKMSALADGIHSYIGKDVSDNGIQLSGGETQKMLLARAFYHDPELLVLDEPTAALDAISEQDLYLQYRDFTAGRSAVFISHRLASTRFCDRIILLEDGRIIEEGNHDSLIASGGRYAEMFEAQSRYYREGGIQSEEDLI